MNKFVYNFNEGSKEMKNILGGKGANLSEMTKIGLPVPPGFTVTTEACTKYYNDNLTISEDIKEEIIHNLNNLEKTLGKTFGGKENPLLVSVRSGSVVSMPGMMDTILNLGLNDETVIALGNSTNNFVFAYDSYRRFIQMFSDVVMGIHKYKFESLLSDIKRANGYVSDSELTVDDLKTLISNYKNIYKKETREDFPQDPKTQLLLAVQAVFKSWNNSRAILYRELNNIDHKTGTAVNIQSMVFGNMGETSGTGVAFTRNPATGENTLFGEYLINAQGEDVVAGIRTPEDIETLKLNMPSIYEEFKKTTEVLEKHYKDMQDIEFTIENEKLYILQTRNGKRTAQAGLKIAIDLVNEGIISKEEAVLMIEPNQLNQVLHPVFDNKALNNATLLGEGLPASPGACSGKVCFTSEEAVELSNQGVDVILVRPETSPEDIEGMLLSNGTLTSRGGMTSHASVVARGMGKCCVAGCSALDIDEISKVAKINGVELKEGDTISLDGSTGKVYLGEIAKTDSSNNEYFTTFMSWVDEIRDMDVRANADNKKDSLTAMRFGADGIGLCRTEHMFFEEDRIPVMRQMILSNNTADREKALDKLMEMQIKDFAEIFEAMEGKNINIRLLDPPLHEFLPKDKESIKELATSMNVSEEELNKRVHALHEFNPMLGHRGCRLLITYPEIAIMQAKAIIHGAIIANKKGIPTNPEIMIPLVGDVEELKYLKERIIESVESVLSDNNISINYQVGTMIETPRACIVASEIANEAQFFSFGTNDLTQMSFGYSRDDSEKFISDYLNKEILKKNPFEVLDQNGVGKLMKLAVKEGRESNPNIKLGICGEHGGEPSSVEFCYKLGLNYVSCSPYRIPIAKLACAQAKIKDNK